MVSRPQQKLLGRRTEHLLQETGTWLSHNNRGPPKNQTQTYTVVIEVKKGVSFENSRVTQVPGNFQLEVTINKFFYVNSK